jgi:hypothetical protein
LKRIAFLFCVGAVFMATAAGAAIACQAGALTLNREVSANFVTTDFVPRSSINSELYDIEDGMNFAARTASSRAKTIYGVSTAGSAVLVCSFAAATPNVARPMSATNPC